MIDLRSSAEHSHDSAEQLSESSYSFTISRHVEKRRRRQKDEKRRQFNRFDDVAKSEECTSC